MISVSNNSFIYNDPDYDRRNNPLRLPASEVMPIGVTWEAAGQHIVKLYGKPIFALVLRDQSGVLIVEPVEGGSRDNAAIFNADGALRAKINNPMPENFDCAFDGAFVNRRKRLVVTLGGVAEINGVRIAIENGCDVDETTGTIINTYEIR